MSYLYQLLDSVPDGCILTGSVLFICLLVTGTGWLWVKNNAKDEPGDHKNID